MMGGDTRSDYRSRIRHLVLGSTRVSWVILWLYWHQKGRLASHCCMRLFGLSSSTFLVKYLDFDIPLDDINRASLVTCSLGPERLRMTRDFFCTSFGETA
jgi:hypothetical protein